MTPRADALAALAEQWRAEARLLRERYADERGARLCEAHVAELETTLRAAADEALTLEQAAAESGYSPERLRKLIADGTIPQAGRRHAPRVKRGDLPTRARRPAASTQYDPDADALRLVRGS